MTELGSDQSQKSSTNETNFRSQIEQVVALWHENGRTLIHFCGALDAILTHFKKDNYALKLIYRYLIDHHIISEREGALGSKSGKISKLRKIGTHANILRHPEVLRHFTYAVYTIYWEITGLYDAYDGTPETRLNALVDFLDKNQDSLSQKFIERERKQIERSTKPVGGPNSPDGASVGLAPAIGNFDGSQHKVPISFDVILFTPVDREIRTVDEGYEMDQRTDGISAIWNVISDDAIAIAVVPLEDVPLIVTKLLPLCGFSRVEHLLLAQRPNEPDVLREVSIVIARRGDGLPYKLPTNMWDADSLNAFDAISFSNKLFPSTHRKLNAFARKHVSGWSSLIGDENWNWRLDAK